MRIINSYVRPGAPIPVPISQRCQTTILRTKATSAFIFGRARREIMTMISSISVEQEHGREDVVRQSSEKENIFVVRIRRLCILDNILTHYHPPRRGRSYESMVHSCAKTSTTTIANPLFVLGTPLRGVLHIVAAPSSFTFWSF